jgi:hypothetical protein
MLRYQVTLVMIWRSAASVQGTINAGWPYT